MKKLFLILFTMVFIFAVGAVQSQAMPIYLDIGTALPAHNYGDADDFTGIFDQFTFKAQTTTTQSGTDGMGVQQFDTFLDVGDLYMTDYAASAAIDTEGLNQGGGHEFTSSWNNITGFVSAIDDSNTADVVHTLIYTGGTMEMYVDDGMDRNFGAGYGAGDNTGFTNGTHVATLDIDSGIGYSHYDATDPTNPMTQGSSDFIGKFSWVLDDFWYNEFGEDLNEKLVALGWLIGIGDQNTDHIVTIPDNDPNNGILYTIESDHDGSIELAAIPEPATMLLLGSGLLGLAGIGRKKKFFKKG